MKLQSNVCYHGEAEIQNICNEQSSNVPKSQKKDDFLTTPKHFGIN